MECDEERTAKKCMANKKKPLSEVTAAVASQGIRETNSTERKMCGEKELLCILRIVFAHSFPRLPSHKERSVGAPAAPKQVQ